MMINTKFVFGNRTSSTLLKNSFATYLGNKKTTSFPSEYFYATSSFLLSVAFLFDVLILLFSFLI